MNKLDLKISLVCAFRYALPRQTYVVSSVSDIIIENKELFNENDIKLFQKEYNEVKDQLWNCDKVTWEHMISELKSGNK